jgi:hypothetical protein
MKEFVDWQKAIPETEMTYVQKMSGSFVPHA